jgi:LacI family transcriptional regulator
MDGAGEAGGSRQDRRVGIRDVANRAGVGLATASRVLSGRTNVNAAMRQRVLAAAEELGYQPDMLAQSLRRGATRSVGFIADDLSNHLIADIATGAERRLRAEGYSLLVMNSEMDPAVDALNVRVLRARRVDALMMAPVEEDDPALVRELVALNAPFVDVEGELPAAVPASYVHSDHRDGVATALRDLIARGHRTIAMIAGPAAYHSARQRRFAVDDVRRNAPADVRLIPVEAPLTRAGGVAATRALLAADDRPSAIVVGGWQLLTGVLEVIRGHDMRLGRDLSLIASDPPPLAAVFDPPLAAITRDAPGLGVRAAELLLARLRDPSLPTQRVMLPTTYRPAGSVGPPEGTGQTRRPAARSAGATLRGRGLGDARA